MSRRFAKGFDMSDSSEKLDKVLELTCELADEQLDRAGQDELAALLFGDPAACEVYLNTTTLHAHLIRELGGQQVRPIDSPALAGVALPGPRPTITPKPATAARSFWRIGTFAAAAALLLAVGLVAVVAWRSSPALIADPAPDLAVATIVEASDVQWTHTGAGGVHVASGHRLSPSAIAISSGTLVLRFDNGAMATLSGPAELLIESRKSAELKSGNVLVRCDQEAVGFTLRTAASDYIDLGTEFGVSVNADDSSEIHVFEGVVVARPRASDLVVPVLRNEAGRVEAARGDLVSIEANPARFTGVRMVSPASRPASAPSTAAALAAVPRDARIVFIGDLATDLETHLLLVDQAFSRIYPDGPRPKLFNAGVTMPLRYKDAEMDRLVLAYKPTHAVIEFGPEIAAGPMRRSAVEFEAEVRRMTYRLAQANVQPIISTGFRLGERQAQCQGILDEYNRVLRRIAAEKNYRLADVDAHFRSLEKYKLSLVAPNGALPTFMGAREMAGVLLAALGYEGTRVDHSVQIGLLPGVITRWTYRVRSAEESLNADTVAALMPDHTWQDLYLPQPEDKFCSRVTDPTRSGMNRDRARGFATNLFHGQDKSVEAIAVVQSRDNRTAWLNTGANVKAVWVNGVNVFDSKGRFTGWHAGKERIRVRLLAGENQIVVEAGSSFFVSITNERDWALE